MMIYLEGAVPAACLITACLIYAGGIGLLLRIRRFDWRLQVGTAIGLLSPLLVLRAFEIFFTLGLQVLLVAVQVRMVKRWLLDRSPEQQPAEAHPAKRFSIATILFITALMAGMIMVVQATPALSPRVWVSQTLIAVAASWCTVIAWLVGNLQWRAWVKWPCAIGAACLLAVPVGWLDELLPSLALPFLSWPFETAGLSLADFNTTKVVPIFTWCAITSALMLYTALMLHLGRGDEATRKTSWLFVVALMLPVLALLGATATQMLLARPQAPPADAAHQRYRRVIELSTRISASSLSDQCSKYGVPEAIPAGERASSLAAIDGDLKSLIQELQHPLAVTLSRKEPDVREHVWRRDAARALLALGTSRLAAQDPDGAMEAFLSAIRLGIEARRGGLELDDLVGVAVTGMSVSYPYQVRHQVSADMRAMACADLAHVIDRLEPHETFKEREREWAKGRGWHSSLQILIDDCRPADATDSLGPDYYNHIRAEELATLRLLILELALSSYAIDHGHYPESLESLVPRYLAALPLDPFAQPGGGFAYSVSDGDYQLYSLSWNGIDDGGSAHPSDPVSGAIDRSVGDLSLRHISAN